jgi:hypothetical protein
MNVALTLSDSNKQPKLLNREMTVMVEEKLQPNPRSQYLKMFGRITDGVTKYQHQ